MLALREKYAALGVRLATAVAAAPRPFVPRDYHGAAIVVSLCVEFPLAGEAQGNGLAKRHEVGDVGAGELAGRTAGGARRL